MRAWIIFVTLLTGCASSHVLVGQARPPISPDLVKIYLHPPAKYQEVAIVDASNRGHPSFTDQGKTDVVIHRLKEEAAKLGANGILLQGIADQAAGSVSSGFGQATSTGHSAYGTGFGISGTVFQKSGQGLAIYVEQE